VHKKESGLCYRREVICALNIAMKEDLFEQVVKIGRQLCEALMSRATFFDKGIATNNAQQINNEAIVVHD
jgi:hypothetical protein